MFLKKQALLFLFVLITGFLYAQNVTKILIEDRWLAFEDFVVIDFFPDGKAVKEYAYCTYCKNNMDTVDWVVQEDLLVVGQDSMNIINAVKGRVITSQYNSKMTMYSLTKAKPVKIDKEEAIQFLTEKEILKIYTVHPEIGKGTTNPIHFGDQSTMWFGKSEYRGQWALRAFYGNLFLIYVNRYMVNRDYPAIKITKIRKNTLYGIPMPTIYGIPYTMEITK